MTRTSTEAVNSYVTDMLALETHIDQALAGQLTDLGDDHPHVAVKLRHWRERISRHIEQLESLQVHERAGVGAGIADSLKRGVAVLAGLGAAAVDAVRGESLPKDLRDDFTAFSLASIGYVMLHTVGMSVGAHGTATIAEVCLRDYAQMLAEVRRLIPGAVVDLLRSEGLDTHNDRANLILEIHEVACRLEPEERRPAFAGA